MATRPKQTEQDVIADSRHVVGAARDHFSEIMAADEQRRNKFLPESRLISFEELIALCEQMVGGQATISAVGLGATFTEGEERAQVYTMAKEIRDEVKLAHLGNPSIGRAFGVGANLNPRSTGKVLAVAQQILSSWKTPEYRVAATNAGVTEERIEALRTHTQALGEADADQGRARGAAVGQTLTKQQALRRARSETTYLRRVARVVFRNQPEVLAEFASARARRAVQPRNVPATKDAPADQTPKTGTAAPTDSK